MSIAGHLHTGRDGEGTATGFLRRNGYVIIDRNVRIRPDEIDIVAYDPQDRVIVFCEVKTRSVFSEDFHPLLNLTAAKRRRMRRAARRWVDAHGWEGGYRMDLVCVAHREVLLHCPDIGCEEE